MLVVFWVCQVNCVMQHHSVLVREQLGDTVHLTSPTYLPIYMLMFIKKEQKLPTKYSIDLSGLV